jgi:uncharacterized protein (DUF885 family)
MPLRSTHFGLPARALAAALLLALAAHPSRVAAQPAATAAIAPASSTPAPPFDAPTSQRLHAVFDDHWEALMRRYPEWATSVGDHRYGDRLYDASPDAEARDFDLARARLARAEAIAPEGLSSVDRVSREVLIHGLGSWLRQQPFVGFRSMSLGALGGFQSEFAELLADTPVETAAQVEQLFARIAAYPRRVEQELVKLRVGQALGWVPPKSVLDRVLVQLDAELAPAPEAGPFFVPFGKLGSEIPAADREAYRARAREAIATRVLPPLRRLRAFVADEYRPAAPPDGSLRNYPGGAAVYAERVQSATTTALTPAQIHAIGLRELARLRGEMEAAQRELGIPGDFAAFVARMNSDPKYVHADAESLLAGYRAIAKRIDPELPKLFAELPRAPYGVRPMAAHMSVDRAEYYDRPALDGSTPGWFNANANAYKTRPTWGMETLVAHEAVPGHHLQIARAGELGSLPRFRRGDGYNAYAEGWALYAETLGFQLGLYRDPASRYGHLQAQAHRAARLVVDTGLHADGWSRQQAIDFLVERAGTAPGYAASEVDRYLSWPGQALGYMIGQLKIIELRDRARAALGERFDIRRFHMVVLDQGSVPLTVLENAVDSWIAVAGGAAR